MSYISNSESGVLDSESDDFSKAWKTQTSNKLWDTNMHAVFRLVFEEAKAIRKKST